MEVKKRNNNDIGMGRILNKKELRKLKGAIFTTPGHGGKNSVICNRSKRDNPNIVSREQEKRMLKWSLSGIKRFFKLAAENRCGKKELRRVAIRKSEASFPQAMDEVFKKLQDQAIGIKNGTTVCPLCEYPFSTFSFDNNNLDSDRPEFGHWLGKSETAFRHHHANVSFIHRGCNIKMGSIQDIGDLEKEEERKILSPKFLKNLRKYILLSLEEEKNYEFDPKTLKPRFKK